MSAGWYYGVVRDRTGREEGAEVALLKSYADAPREWESVDGPYESADRAEYIARSRRLPTRRRTILTGREREVEVLRQRDAAMAAKMALRKANAQTKEARDEARRRAKWGPGHRQPGLVKVSIPWFPGEDYDGTGLSGLPDEHFADMVEMLSLAERRVRALDSEIARRKKRGAPRQEDCRVILATIMQAANLVAMLAKSARWSGEPGARLRGRIEDLHTAIEHHKDEYEALCTNAAVYERGRTQNRTWRTGGYGRGKKAAWQRTEYQGEGLAADLTDREVKHHSFRCGALAVHVVLDKWGNGDAFVLDSVTHQHSEVKKLFMYAIAPDVGPLPHNTRAVAKVAVAYAIRKAFERKKAFPSHAERRADGTLVIVPVNEDATVLNGWTPKVLKGGGTAANLRIPNDFKELRDFEAGFEMAVRRAIQANPNSVTSFTNDTRAWRNGYALGRRLRLEKNERAIALTRSAFEVLHPRRA